MSGCIRSYRLCPDMFSVLPPEIIHKILDTYVDSVGDGYLALQSVNKSIYAYITSTARSYIRDHCYINNVCHLNLRAFIPYLHEQLVTCVPTNYMLIRLKHKYLRIDIAVTNTGLLSGIWNNFMIAHCFIYIGKCGITLDIHRASHEGAPIITFTPVRYIALGHLSASMDFLEEYFNEFYTYITQPPAEWARQKLNK
jgi:hypothetical protein